MGKADLARSRHAAAADETGVRDGVMRCTEEPAGEEGLAGGEEAGDGVELGGLQGFLEGEGWQDRG